MMRVLVCGGRKYRDRGAIYRFLDDLHRRHPDLVIIHGKAPGADELADAWARSRKVPVLPFAADWDDLNARPLALRRRKNGGYYNAAAGSIRNAKMLREGKPHLVAAFPGGKGTKNMMELAKSADVPIVQPAGP